MKITIHRGTNQIGGCVTEYEHDGWRLLVDYGEELPGSPNAANPLEVEGLTHGDITKSALLITHYHGDHIGKIADLPAQLPIYMGKIAKEIQSAFSHHMSSVSESNHKIAQRLETVTVFNPGEKFEFGPFEILPIIIDHSAFDAYAFKIEAQNLTVFHTGDFRTHGFRSKTLPKVIEKYIGRVDYIVCEATNIKRPDADAVKEYELQWKYREAFQENKYNIVYASSTNIDRLFGLYHAAIRAKRPFYVDSFQKKIMDIVAGRDKIWGKSDLYKYKEGREPIVLKRNGDEFLITDSFKKDLEDRGYVLIARAGKRFDNLISEMPSEGRQTYLSMWKGYIDKQKAAYNPDLAKAEGEKPIYLHTSGHCDMKSLGELFNMLKPRAIIPIHTDDSKSFADLFCEDWPILLLNDGDSFSPVNIPAKDMAYAKILCLEKPDESLDADNPDGLRWWKLDDKFIGEFRSREEAYDALCHIVYRPEKVFAYEIEVMGLIDPNISIIYNNDLSVHAEYRKGGHHPKGKDFQENSGFKPGDKVLCLKYSGMNAVFPAIVVGPITKEYLRNEYKNDDEAQCFYSSFNDYLNNWTDWDWDSIIVRPLVRLNFGWEKMDETILVNRIYIFPFKNYPYL